MSEDGDDSASFTGYISRQHTVWCGVCGNWVQVDEQLKKDAIQRFRKLGWSYQGKERGWVCPAHKNR